MMEDKFSCTKFGLRLVCWRGELERRLQDFISPNIFLLEANTKSSKQSNAENLSLALRKVITRRLVISYQISEQAMNAPTVVGKGSHLMLE